MNELERLRDLVRKRRSAVTGKIARIRRNTGVDIAGRGEDPRRPHEVIKKYNSRQLNKYLGELNAFQSRSVGYVPGAKGTPIPKLKWDEYKKLEMQYNTIGIKHEAAISNVLVPTAGMKLQETKFVSHPTAHGEVVNRPYSWVERSSSDIKSVEALEKLTRDMRRKTAKSFLPGEIAKSRKQLTDMLKTAGNPELITRANKLTDSQFDTLWNYTNFATLVSLSYEMAKLRATGGKERWHDSVVEDAADDIGELFSWAEVLPEAVNNVEAKLAAKRQRRRNRRQAPKKKSK